MSDQAGDQVSNQVREQIGDQVNGTDIQRNDRTIKAMEQVSEQAGEQVQMLVNAIREDTVTMFMIQKRLNNASRSFSQMKMLKQAIAQGYVLRAFPDKRSHSKQRYYLSEKGAKLVKIIISTDKLLGCPKCKFCPWAAHEEQKL